MEPGSYVRVLFDFETYEPGELSLRTGDVVRVVRQVNQDWLKGELDSMSGNFPCNFVEQVPVPAVRPGQRLAVGIEDFPAQQDGDLDIRKGDIILITEDIDGNWYRGECGNKTGIFPSLFCKDLPAPRSQDSTIPAEKAEDVLGQAEVLQDLQAQLDEELTLYQGDIVNITKVVDQDWYEGEIAGRTGIFPSAFVKLKGPLKGQTQSIVDSLPSDDSDSESEDEDEMPCARAIFPFQGKDSTELTFKEGDKITLLNRYDEDWIEGELDGEIGIFPATFVEVIIDLPRFDDEGNEITQDALQAGHSETSQGALQSGDMNSQKETVEMSGTGQPSVQDPYAGQTARALFRFDAAERTDLPLEEGETVTIISKVDADWFEARKPTGQSGLVPVGYLEVMEPGSETGGKDFNDISSQQDKNSGKHARALFEFEPSVEADIRLIKDQLYRIVRVVDKDWMEVQDEAGQVGVCPASYLQIMDGSVPQETQPEVARTMEQSKPAESKSQLDKPYKPGVKPKPGMKPKPSVPSGKPTVTAEKPSGVKVLDQKPMRATAAAASHGPIAAVQASLGPSRMSLDSDTSGYSSGYSQEDLTGQRQSATLPAAQYTPQPQEQPPAPVIPSRKAPPRPQQVPQSQRKVPPPRPAQPKRPPPPSQARHVQRPPSPVIPRQRNTIWYVELPEGLASPLVPTSGAAPGRPAPRRKDTAGPRPPRPTSSVEPQRSAGGQRPSVPQRPHSMAVPARKGADLIDLGQSFDGQDAEDGLEVDEGMIQSLQERIAQVEADLLTYEGQKQELEAQLASAQGSEVEQAQENLEFCNSNIEGLTAELNELRDNLRYIAPPPREQAEAGVSLEEIRRKKAEKRDRVVQEIIQTERDYVRDLHVITQGMLVPLREEKFQTAELNVLFGNIEGVQDLAQRFLPALEQSVEGVAPEEQRLGETFLRFSADLEETYKLYCRNHDDALALLEKYEEIEEIQESITRCLGAMAGTAVSMWNNNATSEGQTLDSATLDKVALKEKWRMAVIDLSSLLIKPVQRVLKYPLLLNELLSTTEDDHQDKANILAAVNRMTDVATAINEDKRRKDLVMKYRKVDDDVTLSQKISKLSFHSIRKKSSRFTGRLIHMMGQSELSVDERFNEADRKFHNMEKTIKVFIRNVSENLRQMQEGLQAQLLVAEDITDFYAEKANRQEIENYRTAYRTIVSTHLPKYKTFVEERVVSPLTSLVLMYQAPNKLIQKRYDKMLDYDNKRKNSEKAKGSDKSRAAQEDLKIAKNTYEALNAQLLDELPKLHTMSTALLQDCIKNFVIAHKNIQDAARKELYALLQLPVLLSEGDDILESFQTRHTQVVEQLSSVSFAGQGLGSSKRPDKGDRKQSRKSLAEPAQDQSGGPQTDAQKAQLQARYPGSLYKATKQHTPTQPMDLSIAEGDLIGVIKQQDPMGGQDRWFVDNGEQKGLVPSNCLTPVTEEPPTSSSIIAPDMDLLGPEPSEEPPTYAAGAGDDGSAGPETEETTYQYYAEYGFSARAETELTIHEGQVVTVLQPYDLQGNPEWWLVQHEGGQGYVPANYLNRREV
ncbi:PREDICTED: dynamin-binding protein-like isoform X1 [Branchiostoma belcheri]|uniref:Dynamin-binding protein n=1 Tax=Branchiostoma belcheri TaxID=7741 RepID=A0A6P4XTU8_BRABE|nr:PREDICTED: dynamin-binding protein-like isoform X1 [Branchiostoma belcheri]